MRKILFAITCIILISCSSAPKRPTEIVAVRRIAEQELDLGNKATGQGQFENALLLLTEAKRKATSVDDPSLIIRCSISRGNVLLSMNRTNEAIEEWEAALREAQRIENRELIAVSRLYYARGLYLLRMESPLNVLELIEREQPNIKNKYYAAFSWQLKGLVLRALGSYTEAEESLKKSLDIYEKERYLEDASYNWYIIASVRSLGGDFSGALQALESSMSIDRRIENSWGLAASWNAMGNIYRRMGREQDAQAAHERAEAILNAMY